mmetsp:Transcript_19165/g.53449  ORF Transcript_19165/g.53449 Transcript_19165/m.53449 type:complete len:231 (-) Transcript_19165:257-949(-)
MTWAPVCMEREIMKMKGVRRKAAIRGSRCRPCKAEKKAGVRTKPGVTATQRRSPPPWTAPLSVLTRLCSSLVHIICASFDCPYFPPRRASLCSFMSSRQRPTVARVCAPLETETTLACPPLDAAAFSKGRRLRVRRAGPTKFVWKSVQTPVSLQVRGASDGSHPTPALLTRKSSLGNCFVRAVVKLSMELMEETSSCQTSRSAPITLALIYRMASSPRLVDRHAMMTFTP